MFGMATYLSHPNPSLHFNNAVIVFTKDDVTYLLHSIFVACTTTNTKTSHNTSNTQSRSHPNTYPSNQHLPIRKVGRYPTPPSLPPPSTLIGHSPTGHQNATGRRSNGATFINKRASPCPCTCPCTNPYPYPCPCRRRVAVTLLLTWNIPLFYSQSPIHTPLSSTINHHNWYLRTHCKYFGKDTEQKAGVGVGMDGGRQGSDSNFFFLSLHSTPLHSTHSLTPF